MLPHWKLHCSKVCSSEAAVQLITLHVFGAPSLWLHPASGAPRSVVCTYPHPALAAAERQASIAAQKELARTAAAGRQETQRFEQQEATLKREHEDK